MDSLEITMYDGRYVDFMSLLKVGSDEETQHSLTLHRLIVVR